MNFRLTFAGLLLATVTACSGTWETDNTPKSKPSSPPVIQSAPAGAATSTEISLHAGDLSGQSYTVIKDLKVSVNKTTVFNPDPTVERVEEKLQKEAQKLGGDAVIFVKISEVKISGFSWGTRTGSGQVIRFK